MWRTQITLWDLLGVLVVHHGTAWIALVPYVDGSLQTSWVSGQALIGTGP
jgi:hypothetical protein